MKERNVPMPLTPEEWDLVCLLRDVPAGRARRELMALLRELAAFVAAPGCAEAQADGVPCGTAHAACEECQRIGSCLSWMRGLVGAPPAGRLA